jgi:hypothetical protein
VNGSWISEALTLDECFLDFMVDYISIFLIWYGFYLYAIIFFKSRIILLGDKLEVREFTSPL